MPEPQQDDAEEAELIAHRGYREKFPENTIEGLRAAAVAGARWLEFDIQLTADGVPVLLHDPTLARTTNATGTVMDMEFIALAAVSAGEPDRFGEQFADARVPSVADFADALAEWPGVTAFAEIKQHSIERFGSRYTVARVIESLQPVMDRCVILSFVAEAVAQARELGAGQVGWAIREFSAVTRREADILKPDFLFCDYKVIPKPSEKNPTPLWPGPWRWAVYEVGNVGLAMHLAALGADLIETFDIGSLITHPRLARGA